MKSTALILLAVGMLIVGVGIAITMQKIVIPDCNTCAPANYKPGLFYSWLTSLTKPLDCLEVYDLEECTPSYYIIPIDVFVAGAFFTSVSLAVHIKSKNADTPNPDA